MQDIDHPGESRIMGAVCVHCGNNLCNNVNLLTVSIKTPSLKLNKVYLLHGDFLQELQIEKNPPAQFNRIEHKLIS